MGAPHIVHCAWMDNDNTMGACKNTMLPQRRTSAYGVQSTCANPTVYRTKNQNKEILFLLFELIKP